MQSVDMAKLLREDSLKWIGEHPLKWKYWRLKDVAYLGPSFSADKPEEFDECTLLPMEKVDDDGQYNTEIVQPYIDVSSGLNLIESGDVIIAKITPCMENGKGASIESLPSKYAFGSTEFHIFRPTSKIIARFLYYYTWNPIFRKYAEVNMTGAAGQKRISSRFIKHTIIFLPPLPEQKLISDYLNKTTTTIDNAVAVKKKQLEKLEELRKSIIYKAVTKGLDDSVEMKDSGIEWIGEIPKDWKVKKLKQLTKKINSGVTPKGGAETYLSEGIPLIRSQNVHFKELVFYDMAYIDEETHLNMSNSHVRKGDVLLNITGASIGRCYYYSSENEANVNQHVCIIRPINKNITKLLYQIMASEVGQSQIFSGFRGASREGLNFKDLKNFFIPLPNYNEQQVIINYLDHKTSEIDTVSEKITLQIEKLEEYKKSLIHECVTGKRRITEADVQEAVYA